MKQQCTVLFLVTAGAVACSHQHISPSRLRSAHSTVTQSGPVLAGAGPKIVVVQTAPGYSNNPGHHGSGVVVATFCP